MSEQKEAPAKAAAAVKYSSPGRMKNAAPSKGSSVTLNHIPLFGKLALVIVTNHITGKAGFQLPMTKCVADFFSNSDTLFYGKFPYMINGEMVTAATKKGSMKATGYVIAYEDTAHLKSTINHVADEYNKASTPYHDTHGRFKLDETISTAGSAFAAEQCMSEVLGNHQTAEVFAVLYEAFGRGCLRLGVEGLA